MEHQKLKREQRDYHKILDLLLAEHEPQLLRKYAASTGLRITKILRRAKRPGDPVSAAVSDSS